MHRERLQNFRSRFGISDDPAALERFRTRVIQAARISLAELLENERTALEREFAFRNGSRFIPDTHWGALDGRTPHGILDEFTHTKSATQLIECVQQLLWSLEALGYFVEKQRYGKRDYVGFEFARKLGDAIDLSPGIDLRLHSEPGKVELAPAGVPLLDQQVDRATQWLARYPDVQKEFRQALRILAEKKKPQYRQAQDSLRFGLEKLLKLLLNNDSRLEDQGKPLKEWLSARGVQRSLRDVAVQIMVLLTKQYQNAAVKHDNSVDGGEEKTWNEFEVEYNIYQFATLFRLLNEAAADGSAVDQPT